MFQSDHAIDEVYYKQWKSDIVFCAMAGVDVIGMNLYLYGFRCGTNYQWLVVDFGIGFSLEKHPGARFMTVGIDFLELINKDILACIITHAHEDHMGALAYTNVLNGIPLYATEFSKSLLKEKAKDYAIQKLSISVIKDQDVITLGDVSVTAYDIPHSVPQTMSLLIEAKGKRILHTSDFCFEKNTKQDKEQYLGMGNYVKKILHDPLDVLVSDSTGIISRNEQVKEETVYKNIHSVIAQTKGRVFVTCFSSNIERFRSVYKASQKNKRPFYVLGQSIKRSILAAKSIGIWPHGQVKDFYEAGGDADNAIILISGCQGEVNSTLTRLAYGHLSDVKIRACDTVIYSARVIPGNAQAISSVQNAIAAKNARIVSSEEIPIHAGGHANRQQLECFFKLLHPHTLIPVHGETRHVKEVADLANTMNIESCILTPGQVIGWKDKDNTLIHETDIDVTKYVYEADTFINATDESYKIRRKLCFVGSLSLWVIKNAQENSLDIVKLDLKGIPQAIITKKELEDKIVFFWQNLDNRTFDDTVELEKVTMSFIKKTMKGIYQKKIPCDVVISDINVYI